MSSASAVILPKAIVVMGVAGSGKSTVGAALAERLGWQFRDADSFHPPANVAKMTAGTPLTDHDREPWLAAIAAWLDERCARADPGVVTCSALKRAYRCVLLGGRPDVRLVYLKGEPALIAERMARRQNHFMPTSLLASQFATLEEPTADEAALVAPIDQPPDAIVEHILARLAPASMERG